MEENRKVSFERVVELLREFDYEKNGKEDTIDFLENMIYFLKGGV